MTSQTADEKRLAAFHDRESNRATLHDQRTTQDIVNNLLRKASQGPLNYDDLIHSLTQMHASVRGIDSYLRKWIPAEIYTEHCPPHATDLAQNVFDIPELLEIMLSNLNIRELLATQGISRQFRNAIDASTKLQRKLSLLPHSSKHFHAPFEQNVMPGFTFYSNVSQEEWIDHDLLFAERDSLGAAVLERMMHAEFDPPLAKIGSRCRRMLVFQPPIKQVRAFPDCCYGRFVPTSGGDSQLVCNESGITIGGMLDAATILEEQHRNCPYASIWDMKAGKASVQTTFQAWYPLRWDDPIIAEARADAAGKDVEDEEKDPRWDLLYPFGEAEQRAYDNGMEIPSFEEFAKSFKPA